MSDSRGRGRRPTGGAAALPWLAALVPAALLALAAAAPTPDAEATGLLRVVKTDPAGAVIGGATFAVHRDSPQGQVVRSLSAGDTTVQLLLGTYCVVEVAPPPGYQPAAAPACTTLSPGQPTQSLTFVDRPVPREGGLRVIQTDQSGNTVAAAGAAFRVHAGAPGGPVVANLTTDASGTVQAGGLGAGTYCVEQTAPAPGLQLAPQYTPAQCVPVTGGGIAVVSVADPAAAAPTATPTPTPVPTAAPTGELQVNVTDPSGQPITAPGFTFNVHVGSPTGQVIATVTTDGSGSAVAAALNPATFCVEETTAPDGYQVAPAYSPGACVQVVADLTQGHSPAIVTVTNPPNATPSPSAGGATTASASPSAGGITHLVTPSPVSAGTLSRATLARALIGGGGLLLLAGLVMILVAVRRRQRPPPTYEPPDTWYDSTIT
jgi:uncharacterized surface anchored protein